MARGEKDEPSALLWTRREAAAALGLTPRAFEDYARRRGLRAVSLDDRSRWRVDAVREHVASLPDEELRALVPDPILTVQDCATYLRTGPEFVREAIRDGKLLAFRLSANRWRIMQSDFEAYIRAMHRVPTE